MKYIILILLLLVSCIKQERRDWICDQWGWIYNDSINRTDSSSFRVNPSWLEVDKTNDEIIEIQNRYKFKAWMIPPGYTTVKWVESNCNCDPYICTTKE